MYWLLLINYATYQQITGCPGNLQTSRAIYRFPGKSVDCLLKYWKEGGREQVLVFVCEVLTTLFSQELSTQLKDRLTLRDYLIKPIQRITKYSLFLKNLRKYSVRAGAPLPNLDVRVCVCVCVCGCVCE